MKNKENRSNEDSMRTPLKSYGNSFGALLFGTLKIMILYKVMLIIHI